MRCRSTALLAFVAMIVFGTPLAVAQGKPKVAILGLQVVAEGEVDEGTSKLARDLTFNLRNRAQRGDGPYALAPNSQKELLEMKLLGGCMNEDNECMAKIGKDLGAEFLMWGKVERRADGYQVTLSLLDVVAKAMVRTTTELIQLDDTSKARVGFWSRTLYGRLVGLPDKGTLVVKVANAQSGTVYIDGQAQGTLAGGQAKIAGLSEGNHELRIEAAGFETATREVGIQAGETLELPVSLVPATGGGGDGGNGGNAGGGPVDGGGSSRGGVRMLFYASLATTAGLGAGGYWFRIRKNGDFQEEVQDLTRTWQGANRASVDANGELGRATDNNICKDIRVKNPGDDAGLQGIQGRCDEGQSAVTTGNILLIGAGVTATVSAFLLYKAFIASDDSSDERMSAGKRRQQPAFVIVPEVAPGYVGAGMALSF